MGKTKLGLKEPFSCLNSKYHTWAIQINHLFSLFQPQTAKKLWIECQKHENIGYFWNKVCSHNTVDTDLFKTFTENTKQKEVTEAPFSLLFACSQKVRNSYLVFPAHSATFNSNCKKKCNAIINGKKLYTFEKIHESKKRMFYLTKLCK